MSHVGLHQNLQEVLNVSVRSAAPNNADTPGLQGLSVGEEEFLASKIPSARITRLCRATVVLDFRWWQNTGLCLDLLALKMEQG
jgi:hypothetical protein